MTRPTRLINDELYERCLTLRECRWAIRHRIAYWDERRSGYWCIIDALHGDLPRYRTPEYLSLVDRALAELKEDYLARRIRAELGIVA